MLLIKELQGSVHLVFPRLFFFALELFMTSWTLQVRWFTNVVAMLSLRVQDFNLQSSPCWWILVVPVCSCCWLKTPSLEHDPQGFLLVAEPQDCSRNYVYCLNQAFLVRTHSRLPKTLHEDSRLIVWLNPLPEEDWRGGEMCGALRFAGRSASTMWLRLWW